MPEFNNIVVELTNAEKFALTCGMLAGLRLQDKTQPPDQVTVTLEPIGVNGLGTIGLMSEDIQYTGINKLRIPVITHDVDREYSGFSLLVEYNSGRIVINSIDDGDFGILQGTSIKSGRAYTRCMLDKGMFFDKPMIVCWLNCTILQPPTKGNPIELKFVSNTGYNPNFCTLLTWVLNETDQNYYSYFITPTVNKGCKITSEDVVSTESNIGGEQQVSANASPSLIALGTAVIYPGKQSLIPIYTNCNKKDMFVYNGFTLKVIVPKQWLDILDTVEVVSAGEWTLQYTKGSDTSGNLVLDILGSRAEAKADNSTAGFIRFYLSEIASSISCILENRYSELTGPTGALGVVKGDGYLGYPPPPPGATGGGGGSIGFGGGSSGWGSGGGVGGGSGGGMFGSGGIWSGSSQDAWIDLGNGNRYPVHLEPGHNDVNIWIPNIQPEDKWEETTPTIDVPGYILIPGGFEWETVINPEAPLGLSSPRIVDRFEMKDVMVSEVYKPVEPVDLDNIIDNIDIVDIESMTIEEVNILMREFIETFEIGDNLKDELINIVSTDKDFIENIEIKDLLMVDIERPPTTYDEVGLDEFSLEDTDLVTLVNIDIISEPNEERVGIDDLTYTDTLKCYIKEQNEIESLGVTDVITIDRE